jgi:hypothetical protein
MEYLNSEAQKLVEKFNTPERVEKWEKGVAAHLRKIYAGDDAFKKPGYKLVGFARKMTNYSYEYEQRHGGDNPEFRVALVTGSGIEASNALKFSIAAYPHCCGMHQLNGFVCQSNHVGHEVLSQDDVNQLMAGFISIYRTKGDHRLTRLIMNMVEYRRLDDRRNELREVLPIDNPEMAYPEFWRWAHTQQRVRDMLMVNGNSGNVLHHMEIILK